MGRRKQKQSEMFAPAARGAGHPFYKALDELLRDALFDEKVEELCKSHYGDDDKPGRPSIPPGLYFRMNLIGYFEGIGSERGLEWRCGDSSSLREFLGLVAHEPVPDHTTIARTRRRLPEEVFDAVFQLALGIVKEQGLFKGRVRGVDSTYLRADASMKSIVRHDTGEGYREYIKGVAAEADGTEKASAEDAVRHDRKRTKKTSNKDWKSPTDEDARIARMKDGTTRLGYKAEHVVDMETGAILAAEVFKGDEGDTCTMERSLDAAEVNIAAAATAAATTSDQGAGDDDDDANSAGGTGEAWHKEPVAEVVADKGYHKAALLLSLKQKGYRTFIPEKKQRGRRKFTDKGGIDAARAFHANRARTERPKGKRHQRRRGELLERPNQHLYDRGDLRFLTTTGHANATKRVRMQAAAFNLGLVLRALIGAGAPRWFAERLKAFLAIVNALLAVAAELRDAFARAAQLHAGAPSYVVSY